MLFYFSEISFSSILVSSSGTLRSDFASKERFVYGRGRESGFGLGIPLVQFPAFPVHCRLTCT